MGAAERAPTLAPRPRSRRSARRRSSRRYRDEPPQMKSGAVGKSGCLRLGFERRDGRTILADLESRTPCLAQRALHCDDALPDMAWLFMITTVGLRAAGRSAGARRVARTGRAGARHHAVGDQDPLDGRQLRAADAVVHAGRGRVPRVPPRSADPAPPGAVRERHADHHRPDRPRCSARRSCSPVASTTTRTSASAPRCCRWRRRPCGPAGSRCSARSW